MYVEAHTHTFVCTHREIRSSSFLGAISLNFAFICLTKTFTRASLLDSEQQDPPVSTSPFPLLRLHRLITLGFFFKHGFLGSNTGPHACMVRILQIITSGTPRLSWDYEHRGFERWQSTGHDLTHVVSHGFLLEPPWTDDKQSGEHSGKCHS